MPRAELLLDLLPFSLRSKDWLLSSIMGRALAANKQAHAWDGHPKTSTHRQCLDYCSLAAGLFSYSKLRDDPKEKQNLMSSCSSMGSLWQEGSGSHPQARANNCEPLINPEGWCADVSAGRAYNRHKAGIGKEGPQENKIPRSPWDSFK